jgi:4-hydroxy-3-methylbut-2-en-1-yl diphosphate synthase IspG/GcpE
MKFMKKEKINKFRINLGAIGREDNNDKVYIEVEYEDRKDNKVKVGYSIGIYGCGMLSYVVGYEIDVNSDEDIEEILFNEARRLHENGYFYSALWLFYEELDYLEARYIFKEN